jgi:Reverse transcriptase (RNA-dependent DNA polymerase)
VRDGTITGLEVDMASQPGFCTACAKAKPTRKPVPQKREGPRATKFGEKVHSDVWGPANPQSYDGKEYFVSFTDDHNRWTYLVPMARKSEAFRCYKQYEAWVETQHGVRLKRLQTDRGGEYLSDEFTAHLKSKGTVRSLTVHDTPEENGVSERLNRTLLEHARAMHLAAGLPKFLWTESVQHAVWLKNRTSTRALDGKTPYESMHREKPNLTDLPEWGTRVFTLREDRGKLEAKADEGRWVGYSDESKGHRVYWPGKRRVTVERNIAFDESILVVPSDAQTEGEPTTQTSQGAARHDHLPAPRTLLPPDDPPAPQKDPLEGFEAPDPPDEPPQGRGQRVRKPSAYIRDIADGAGSSTGRANAPMYPKGLPIPTGSMALAALEELEEASAEDERVTRRPLEHAMAASTQSVGNDPISLSDARSREDWPLWDASIKRELDQHATLRTWDLVEPPGGVNIVGSKLVFHYKHDANGNVVAHKTRLVAQGFTQTQGIDYNETFSPTAKLSAIRIIIAIAIRNDWELEQTDIDGAYLNAPITETIYMRQARGYETPGKEHYVCRLNRAIYGLKQSGREWYDMFCRIMYQFDFTRCETEHAVFHRYAGHEALIVAVDVDDLTMAGNSKGSIRRFKDELRTVLKIKDLGDLSWLLGIEVKRDRKLRTVSLSQRAYIEKIIERFNLQDAHPLSTPLDPHHKLSLSQSPSTPHQFDDMRNVPYREAIGSLMYAALGTRPDISFAVSFLAQFMQNPGRPHWEAVKRVFRYLKGTKGTCLVIGGSQGGLEAYSDADWASQEHRHSVSGYVFTIDGGAVSWSSKKQPIVALSTTEAEYIAATHAAKEALWLRAFLADIARPLKNPITIHLDNISAISITKNDEFHPRTKHIDIRYHFIRHATREGLIHVDYVPTDDMAADMFTKALPRHKVAHLNAMVGLRSA